MMGEEMFRVKKDRKHVSEWLLADLSFSLGGCHSFRATCQLIIEELAKMKVIEGWKAWCSECLLASQDLLD